MLWGKFRYTVLRPARLGVTLLMAAAALAPPAAAQSTATGFASFDGCRSVDEEASRAGYRDWASLVNVSFGATNPSDPVGGGGAARPELSAISIIKRFDGCTTSLLRWAMQGRFLDKVEMVVTGAPASGGGPRTLLLRIRLDRVVVVKASYGPAQEAVNLAFQKIRVEHVPTGTVVEYDAKTNIVN